MRIVLLILAAALDLQAQVISGSVRDRQSGELLPYATIGIKGKSIGVIADRNAKFQYDLQGAVAKDSLVIRYLGYQHLSFCVGDLKDGVSLNVKLLPDNKMLREVVVYDRKQLTALGNDEKSFYHTGWGFNESERGRTRGLRVERPEFPLFLVSFHMHLHENTFDSVRFRLHLLHATEAFEPLVNENIFLTTSKKRGWIEFDLKPYQIVVSQPFVLAVEWVDAWGRVKGPEEESHIITISEGRGSGQKFYREKPEEPVTLQSGKRIPSLYVKGYAAK